MNTVFTPIPNPFNGILNRIALILFALIYFSSMAFAGSLNLAWDASPSSDVGGYKIYYGQTSQNYTASVDVGNVTAYQMTGLQDGATYFFALKAYNTAKSIESAYSNEASATVSTISAVSANFSANITSGNPGMVVAFTPITTGTITQWLWNFGDGGTSTAQNPTHTYNLAGSYSVSLTVTGSTGSGSATKITPNFITVTNPTALPPVAGFSVDSVTGGTPKTVNFTDTSTGSITTRLWDFGDSSTSTLQNPSHTYSVAGTYTVSLTATGSGGSNTIKKSSLITITSQPANNNGPVAFYNFEGNSTTTVTDLSGYGNHGAIKEAAIVTDGRFGKALSFDGVNDLVTINDSASLDLSAKFTLEAWVKPAAIKRSSVIFKEQPGSSTYNLYAYEDADLWSSSFNDGLNEHVTSSTNALPINQWTHIVSTYDGAKLQLYKNGVLESSSAQSGPIKISEGVLQIGGNSIWGEYFQGYIDEVKVYNRALTTAEILVDMQNSSKVIVGNKTLEPTLDKNPQGTAEAFKTTALQNGTVNALQIYLDASSLTKVLVAGIYSDNAGHPGTLLAKGKLTTVKAGATNTVAIPPIALATNKLYWIAILGARGEISFRDRMGTGNVPLETSYAKGLTSLPSKWVTGAIYPKDGPISAYGSGY
jgi:PKD repeat protein